MSSPHPSWDRVPAGEMKDVALVITDVAGSTSMIARHGSLVAGKAINQAFRRTKLFARRRGGQLIKVVGDSCLLIFGNVEGAFAFAIRLRHSLVYRPIRVGEMQALRVRICLDVGRVRVTETDYGEDVFGEVVVRAARLSILAEPNGILLSEAASNALPADARAELGQPEALDVKGFDKPATIFRAKSLERGDST